MDVVDILRRAAPGLPVERVGGSGKAYAQRASARVKLRNARSVHFAYLEPRLGEVALVLYPADTLEQARHLYWDPTQTERLLALRQHGWEVQPNFHFGYAEKGLTWAQTGLSSLRRGTAQSPSRCRDRPRGVPTRDRAGGFRMSAPSCLLGA